MLIADSHEFIELYRGDKDLRLGMEMVALDDDVRFVSLAPNRTSPNDRERFSAKWLQEIGLPPLPERFDLRLLPSLSMRFARRESGGIVSLMPRYGRSLRELHPDVIVENPFSWLTPRSYQTYAYSVSSHVPVVYYDPGDDIPISTKHKVMALWESRVVRHASAIITYNQAGKRRFEDKYGYPCDRISVIPKPVDVPAWRSLEDPAALRGSLGVRPGGLLVGYVGRLTMYKGSRFLLDAARMALGDPVLRDTRFVFIGGALASADSADYNLPNTVVTGMVPHHDLPRYLAAVDVLVFPDVTRPGGFPTAVAEAMAAGKTLVVGTGDRRDFMPLEHGETALITSPADPSAILAALRALAQDRGLATDLGAAVGRYAAENMDYPVVASRYLDILRGVCASERC